MGPACGPVDAGGGRVYGGARRCGVRRGEPGGAGPRLLGPNGARDEIYLAAAAQNLHKMAKIKYMPQNVTAKKNDAVSRHGTLLSNADSTNNTARRSFQERGRYYYETAVSADN